MKIIKNTLYTKKHEAAIMVIVVIGITAFIATMAYLAITYVSIADNPTQATATTRVTTHAEHLFLLNRSINNVINKSMIDADVHYLADTACNEVYVPACSNIDRLMGVNEEGKIE